MKNEMRTMKNITQIKFNSQWWSVLTLFAMLMSFTSCEKDCIAPEDTTENTTETYPLLKVVNQLNDDWRSINGVSLVGYQFSNLNIEYNGDSQTFVLDKGMSGGYEDIYVKVNYWRYSGHGTFVDIKVNFVKGETTTITLKGTSGCEGCPGIYLE